jgi:hypothetical protein
LWIVVREEEGVVVASAIEAVAKLEAQENASSSP